MNPSHDPTADVDHLVLTVHGADTSHDQLGTVSKLYAEIFAEPPYCEGDAEVEKFVSDWPNIINQPNFRLIIAHRAGEPIGFSFGHQLQSDTTWWDDAITTLPDDLTTEWVGRTFAMIELAVRQPHRKKGVARWLHTHLTAGLCEERIMLLVRPDASAPQNAYLSWGYEKIGPFQPISDGPIYHGMAKTLTRPR